MPADSEQGGRLEWLHHGMAEFAATRARLGQCCCIGCQRTSSLANGDHPAGTFPGSIRTAAK